MGLPAKRRTKQSKRERATHLSLDRSSTISCSHCHRRIRPHLACPHCGYYKGRLVLKIQGRAERRAERRKRKSAEQAPSK